MFFRQRLQGQIGAALSRQVRFSLPASCGSLTALAAVLHQGLAATVARLAGVLPALSMGRSCWQLLRRCLLPLAPVMPCALVPMPTDG